MGVACAPRASGEALLSLFLFACVPDLPEPEVRAAQGDLARGEYVANHVAVCVSCHSQRDWGYLNAPNTDGRLGAGAGSTQQVEEFPDGAVVWTRNITPTALGDWSDGQVARAVTSGLSRDGSPLFLNMPFDQYNRMAKSDLASVLAYLRTLDPQPDEVPARVLPFPLGLVVRTFPLEAQMPESPPERGTPAYGEYLANLASCVWCHSPVDSNSVVVEGQQLQGWPPVPGACSRWRHGVQRQPQPRRHRAGQLVARGVHRPVPQCRHRGARRGAGGWVQHPDAVDGLLRHER